MHTTECSSSCCLCPYFTLANFTISDSVSIPRLVLFLAILFATVLATTARNHQGLSASLQPTVIQRKSMRSRGADEGLSTPQVFNAFTITTVLFSAALLAMAFILPRYALLRICYTFHLS
jgi:hypothetical protein